MFSEDPRAQLLANLKCLYGSNVEVLTFCVPDEMCQAVAASFDPLTATWTKFLHSELVCASGAAINALLKDSEKELAKLLSAGGNTVPFQGVIEQTFILRREGQRSDSICADNMRSDPSVIGIPASTLLDTSSRKFVEAEHPVEVPASGESLVNKVEEHPEDNWGSWGVSETKKNGGKKVDPEAPKVELIAEESAPPEDEWSFSKKKDKKKKGKSDAVFGVPEEQIEEPATDIIPDNTFGWGSLGQKKDKKKKGKSDAVFSVPEEQIEEPAADIIPDNTFGWGSLGQKKDKKKKGKSDAVFSVPEEQIEEPAVDVVPDVDFGWGSFSPKKDKKKKDKSCVVEEPSKVEELVEAPDPVPDPVNDAEDDWGTLSAPKKAKKGKGKKSIIEALAPTPTLPVPDEIESVSDPVSDPKLDELPASSPLPPPSPSASELAQLTQTLRTVVFTIELPNELSDKSLQVMATIADDTRTAIIESVNSYLDLQGIQKGIQVQRKVKIKYGMGRNGHVDVSTLEETMWPQYLDYFRQYTRIPELTLEIME